MGTRASKASAPATPPLSRSEASSCSSLPPPSEASSYLPSWSDLPADLAGLVLRRFPSLADRVRFGSVCRHWRHAARQQSPVLPPVLPWTMTSCTDKVQSITDGEVRRLCSRKFWICTFSSAESWLLVIGRASLHTEIRHFLVEPLSGATLPLPGADNLLHPGGQLYYVMKFIVCPDNLVVATVRSPTPPNYDPLIACCRPGMLSSWSTSSQADAHDGDLLLYIDIAFHVQSIYAINHRGDLFVHEVSDGHGVGNLNPTVLLSSGKLAINNTHTRRIGARRFLVVSHADSRLLMVQWNHPYLVNHYEDISAFEVYEADLQMPRWSRLSSIGDQVLFVSERCSKAVSVSGPDDYLCGNHIYFVVDDNNASYGPEKFRAGNTSCGMYDLGSNTYHPIASGRFIEANTWFFPRN